jgi:hypothetical protein
MPTGYILTQNLTEISINMMDKKQYYFVANRNEYKNTRIKGGGGYGSLSDYYLILIPTNSYQSILAY